MRSVRISLGASVVVVVFAVVVAGSAGGAARRRRRGIRRMTRSLPGMRRRG